MTSSNYAYQTFDDIVFEGRNREYGAYLLRKVYTRNLWRALVTASSVFLLFISVPLLVAKIWPEEVYIAPAKPIEPVFKIIDVPIPDVPKIIPPEETAPTQATKAKITKFVVPVIVNNTVKPTDVPEQEILKHTEIGKENRDGEANVKPPVAVGPEVNTGAGTAEPAPVILPIADQMPEFPGGYAAMQKYLSENLVYPNIALRNSLQGTVILSFVVNTQGEISGIQVLKPLGGGTEAEAIRVLKSMPRWNPGKNNGIPVNVRFTVPFKFTLR